MSEHAGTYTAQGLGSHQQVGGYVSQRGPLDDFGMVLQQQVVALAGGFETPGIGLVLGNNEGVFQYLAVEHVDFPVFFGQLEKPLARELVEDGGLYGLYHQFGGYLAQETFDTHGDAPFVGEVFGDVFTVFIVKLANHSFADEYDFVGYFSFFQGDGAFGKFLTDEHCFYLSSSFLAHFGKTGVDNGVHCVS